MTLAGVAAYVRKSFEDPMEGNVSAGYTEAAKWILKQFEADPEFTLRSRIEALAEWVRSQPREFVFIDAHLVRRTLVLPTEEFARRLHEILEGEP